MNTNIPATISIPDFKQDYLNLSLLELSKKYCINYKIIEKYIFKFDMLHDAINKFFTIVDREAVIKAHNNGLVAIEVKLLFNLKDYISTVVIEKALISLGLTPNKEKANQRLKNLTLDQLKEEISLLGVRKVARKYKWGESKLVAYCKQIDLDLIEVPIDFLEKEKFLSFNKLCDYYNVPARKMEKWFKHHGIHRILKKTAVLEIVKEFPIEVIKPLHDKGLTPVEIKNALGIGAITSHIKKALLYYGLTPNVVKPELRPLYAKEEVLKKDIESIGFIRSAKKHQITSDLLKRFCRIIGFKFDSYAESKLKAVERLNRFDKETYLKLYNQGKEIPEMSKIMDIKEVILYRKIKKLELPSNGRLSNNLLIIQNLQTYVNANHNDRLSLPEVIEKFKVDISPSRLRSIFNLNGFEVKKHHCSVSKGEIEVFEFIQRLDSTVKQSHRFKYNNGEKWFELDVYSEKHKFAVEYCGEFWHSYNSGATNKTRHAFKQQECEKKGIKLFLIWESEWKNKQDLLKSMIEARMGYNITNIYGRQCVAKHIENYTAKAFHLENHINGYVNSSINIGLFLKDKLVSVASFAKSRFDKNREYEITRYSTLRNYRVIGGFSKMFKFSKIYSCMTYADLRFGTGEVYLKSGFVYESTTPPNYQYFKDGVFESRMKFQKKKIQDLVPNGVSKSEYEIMCELDYLKVYDCGSKKYYFTNSNV